MRGVCRCASVYSVARRASVYVCVGMGGIENFILQYVVEKNYGIFVLPTK